VKLGAFERPVTVGHFVLVQIVFLAVIVMGVWGMTEYIAKAREHDATRQSIDRARTAYANAVRARQQAVLGCGRNQRQAVLGIVRDVDLREFARDAAAARRAAGQPLVADKYDSIADRAHLRIALTLGPDIYAAWAHDKVAPNALVVWLNAERLKPHHGGTLVNCQTFYRPPRKPLGVS
jgi:hypothetical protein